jgi:hypothetical protein
VSCTTIFLVFIVVQVIGAIAATKVPPESGLPARAPEILAQYVNIIVFEESVRNLLVFVLDYRHQIEPEASLGRRV